MYPNYQHQADEQIRVGDKIVKINLGKFGEQTSADVLARCGDNLLDRGVVMPLKWVRREFKVPEPKGRQIGRASCRERV